MPRKAIPVVDNDRCTGCGRCVAACPEHVLCLQPERADGMGPKHAFLFDEEDCTGCAKCTPVCPFDAIHMVRIKKPDT